MQVKYDDASSTLVQTISADHADVSHFLEAILHPKKAILFLFSMLFNTQLVHNYFYSTIPANHAQVSHFLEAILRPKQSNAFSFSMFFDAQLVHNYFYGLAVK